MIKLYDISVQFEDKRGIAEYNADGMQNKNEYRLNIHISTSLYLLDGVNVNGSEH